MWARSSSRTELAALAALAFVCCRAEAVPIEGPPLRIAAAADLSFAFKDLGQTFEKKTGQRVVFSFGSTGLLAKQIEEGAPFDVFAAANVSFADETIRTGVCSSDSKALYARGRIVVWTRKGARVKAPKILTELADPRFVKIAIANPEHAPYGKAAMQAFAKAGITDRIKGRLVFGENVQQTLQYAQSGNAEAAVVALSLAIVAEGEYLLIDETLHDPIDQALVTCGKNPTRQKAAREFTAFVNSAEGRQIMRRYGFLLPGEVAMKSARP